MQLAYLWNRLRMVGSVLASIVTPIPWSQIKKKKWGEKERGGNLAYPLLFTIYHLLHFFLPFWVQEESGNWSSEFSGHWCVTEWCTVILFQVLGSHELAMDNCHHCKLCKVCICQRVLIKGTFEIQKHFRCGCLLMILHALNVASLAILSVHYMAVFRSLKLRNHHLTGSVNEKYFLFQVFFWHSNNFGLLCIKGRKLYIMILCLISSCPLCKENICNLQI